MDPLRDIPVAATSKPPKPGRGRGGFTLIELLVVMAIIAVLASLVAAGIMSWLSGQARRNTEMEIRSVNTALLRHWDVVTTDAKNEAKQLGYTGANVKNWVQARLAEAFPVTFDEINNPYAIAPSNLIPIQKRRYLAGYKSSLAKMDGTKHKQKTESSACLLMALSVNREGVTNSPDAFQPFVKDSDSDNVPEFVDGWNEPLYFFRFPGTTNAEYTANLPAIMNPLKTPNAVPPPCVVSPGPNLNLGISIPMSGASQSMLATNAKDADDNIYGFKIK